MNPFRQLKRYLIYKLKPKIDIDSISTNFKELDLDQIFMHFGCNKATEVLDQSSGGHGYSKFYEKYLNSYKNKKINILEIGSFAGASAASFVKYFPHSTVYCLDINLTNFKYTSEKIKVFGMDVSKKTMVNDFYRKIKILKDNEFFDIIIDDGSHKLSDILSSLGNFYKNLRPGGFYIIEEFKYPNFFPHLNDCNESKIDELLNFLKDKKNFKTKIIDEKNIQYILDYTKNISTHTGLVKNSDIAFIEKLN